MDEKLVKSFFPHLIEYSKIKGDPVKKNIEQILDLLSQNSMNIIN